VRVAKCDHFTLAPDKAAVREARLHVRALGELPRDTEADAELVVSELVANSVLHARLGPDDVIEVTIRVHDDRLSIEVVDCGNFSGRPRTKGGWGFRVLDEICESWHADHGRVSATIAIKRGRGSPPPQCRADGVRLRSVGSFSRR
jgi:two-component sensor histidine kinase